ETPVCFFCAGQSSSAVEAGAAAWSSVERRLLDKDEARLLRNLALSSSVPVSSCAGGGGREEETLRKTVNEEEVKRARRFVKLYCRRFGCTYTPGLLFQARILLRFFSTTSSSSSASAVPTAALLDALHSFRCRYTSRVLAGHARVEAQRMQSEWEAGSKRSSLSSVASSCDRSTLGKRTETEGVPWVILEASGGLQKVPAASSLPAEPAATPPPPVVAGAVDVPSETEQTAAREGSARLSGVDAGNFADGDDDFEDVRLDDDATRMQPLDSRSQAAPSHLHASAFARSSPAVQSVSVPSASDCERGEAREGDCGERKQGDYGARGREGEWGKLLESLIAYHLPFLGIHLHRTLLLLPENYACLQLASAFASCCYPAHSESDAADDALQGTRREGEETVPRCLSFPLHREGRDASREDKETHRRHWDVYAAEVCVQQLWRLLVLSGEPAAPALVLLSLLSQQAADLSCAPSPSAATSLLAALSLSDAEADFGTGLHAGVSLVKSKRTAEVAVSRLPLSFLVELSADSSSSCPSTVSSCVREGLATAFRLWHGAALYGVQTPRSFSLRLASVERGEAQERGEFAEKTEDLVRPRISSQAEVSSSAEKRGEEATSDFEKEEGELHEVRATEEEKEDGLVPETLEASSVSPVETAGVYRTFLQSAPVSVLGSLHAQPIMAFEAHELVQALKETARIKCEYVGLLQEEARLQESEEKLSDLLVPENFLLAHWPPSLIGIDILFPALPLAAHLTEEDFQPQQGDFADAFPLKSSTSAEEAARPALAAPGCPTLPMAACLSTLLDVVAFVLEAWTMTLIDCRTLEEVEKSSFVRLAHAVLVDGQVLKKRRPDAPRTAAAPGEADGASTRGPVPDMPADEGEREDSSLGDSEQRGKASKQPLPSSSFLDAGFKTLFSTAKSASFLDRSLDRSPESRPQEAAGTPSPCDGSDGEEERKRELAHVLRKCAVARGKPVTVFAEDPSAENDGEDNAQMLATLLIENQFVRVSHLLGGWAALVAAIERAELSAQLLTESLVSPSFRLSDGSSAAAFTAGAAAALQEWSSRAREKARGWVQASASKTQAFPLK
ncbi:hypothetical protein TGMAS_230400B, partial [Toxoplasma gondii MAS]